MKTEDIYKAVPALVKERFGRDVTTVVVEQVIKAYMSQIMLALVEGKTVTLTDIGKLEVVRTKARAGRNPQTGEAITIPATDRVKFKQSKVIGRILNT